MFGDRADISLLFVLVGCEVLVDCAIADLSPLFASVGCGVFVDLHHPEESNRFEAVKQLMTSLQKDEVRRAAHTPIQY